MPITTISLPDNCLNNISRPLIIEHIRSFNTLWPNKNLAPLALSIPNNSLQYFKYANGVWLYIKAIIKK